MEKILFLSGIAGVVGGVSVIFYQAITFLRDDVWNPYSLLDGIERVSSSLSVSISGIPALANVMEQCPLSAGLIAIGVLLLLGAGRLRNKYA
ncbi:MAG TPA: hypothetical protein PLR71_00595 [Deltaproteobacteria bacterium]|nr:hypothetical protein [Deltaproteobacteria bacterium]HQI80029.1 hypothetical protein [Deltaproteobacteria bacterium]